MDEGDTRERKEGERVNKLPCISGTFVEEGKGVYTMSCFFEGSHKVIQNIIYFILHPHTVHL